MTLSGGAPGPRLSASASTWSATSLTWVEDCVETRNSRGSALRTAFTQYDETPT